MRLAERGRSLWATERPFVVALTLGTLLRLVIAVTFAPAFVMSDGPAYLALVDHLAPSPNRPVGYGVLLRALSWVTRSLVLVTSLQVVLGLLTAVLAYALLRRWGVSTWVATLATLPFLFDSMELLLEHSVLSDVLFGVLLVAGVAALAWWPTPRLWATAAAGLLLGLATVVRLVGEPTVLAAALFLLMAATTWRRRLAHVALVCVAFALPLVAYAGWYHEENGVWALSQASGRAFYMRTTTFVDCAKLDLPSYEKVLCPANPLSDRQDPTWYGWHSTATVPQLKPPPGITQDQAMRDFAIRVIKAQPLDYARIAARDFVLPFRALQRDDRYEYSTAVKWTFAQYVDYVPTPLWTEPAFAEHGGQLPVSRQPAADAMATYGRHVFVPGPVLALLVVLVVAGLVVRRHEPSSRRPLTVLLLVLPLGLSLVPDLTAEFVWRYELTLFTLLPMSAALAWTRLRASRAGRDDGQPGTTATPSTD
jgi:hypothetical protein